MASIRNQHSAQFKFNVALEAARGVQTINELAGQYSLHPTQISHWKQQLMMDGATIFQSVTSGAQRRQEAERAELLEQIGRLKMELEWLKKKVQPQLKTKG